MFVAGLTGGIGSGKSTFAALLAERGAQVIDADAMGREALEPGRPSWSSVVGQFGDEILNPGTMKIDRRRLAEIVFNDPRKLAALNAIVHPEILKGIADAIDRLRLTDAVVVIDAALIVELGLADGLDALIVIAAGERARKQRLMEQRDMSEADIIARMRRQTGVEDQLERADIVVNNDGSLEDLAREADRVWAQLQLLAGEGLG